MDASLFLRSSVPGPRLRVGFLADSTHVPAWAAEIVDHVRRTVSVWRGGKPVKLGDFVR